MQKESNWECITVTSSKPITKIRKRALEVAPSRDGVIELTVGEVFQAVNERRQKLANKRRNHG
jgi:hypothetical protein